MMTAVHTWAWLYLEKPTPMPWIVDCPFPMWHPNDLVKPLTLLHCGSPWKPSVATLTQLYLSWGCSRCDNPSCQFVRPMTSCISLASSIPGPSLLGVSLNMPSMFCCMAVVSSYAFKKFFLKLDSCLAFPWPSLCLSSKVTNSSSFSSSS